MTPSRRLSSHGRALRSSFLALLALAAAPVAPARAGWFSTDPTYAGYRIPEHRWSQWTAFGDGFLSHYMDAGGSEYRQNRLDGRLGSGFTRGYDSDRLSREWSVSAVAHANRLRNRSESNFPPSTSFNERTDRGLDQTFATSINVRSYPWRMPIAVTAGMSHMLDLHQVFGSSNGASLNPPSENRSTSSEAIGIRNYQAVFSLGTGVGHVRDATPVYQAQVLENRLQRTGALSRPLSEDARVKLAALFSVESDLGHAHQRSNKYFWREVERVLREDVALSRASLEAWDILRLLEPISVSALVGRRTGWFVGPSINVITRRERTTHEFSSSNVTLNSGTVVFTNSNSSSTTTNERRDDVFTSFVAEIHRPIDPRWQLGLRSTTSLSEAGEGLTQGFIMTGSYIVSDRWLASFTGLHSLFARGHGLDRRAQYWNVDLFGELNYFLEDSWALRLTARERQAHSPWQFSREGSLQLGISYVISGLFEAPGVVAAMRPTPPAR